MHYPCSSSFESISGGNWAISWSVCQSRWKHISDLWHVFFPLDMWPMISNTLLSPFHTSWCKRGHCLTGGETNFVATLQTRGICALQKLSASLRRCWENNKGLRPCWVLHAVCIRRNVIVCYAKIQREDTLELMNVLFFFYVNIKEMTGCGLASSTKRPPCFV